MCTGFWWENLRDRYHLGDPDLQEVEGSCGDWMELAQDRETWRGLVGTVRNLRGLKMQGIS